MSAVILDAGALVGIDRDDRTMAARLAAAHRNGLELRTNAMVVAQAWRNRRGRPANLARLLHAVDVRPIDETTGRAAGVLIGTAGTSDPIDATVVLLADRGDRILTSDPEDIRLLAATAGCTALILTC